MAFQTSISVPKVAVAGQLADSTDGSHDVTSGHVASGTVVPGTYVYRASGQDAFANVASAANVGKGGGFVLQVTHLENASSYTAPCMVPVCMRGRIWVKVTASITPARGDIVFVTHADGTVSNAAGAGPDATAVTAKFDRYDSTSGLALIDLG